jgi:hypothetical protein
MDATNVCIDRAASLPAGPSSVRTLPSVRTQLCVRVDGAHVQADKVLPLVQAGKTTSAG